MLTAQEKTEVMIFTPRGEVKGEGVDVKFGGERPTICTENL